LFIFKNTIFQQRIAKVKTNCYRGQFIEKFIELVVSH